MMPDGLASPSWRQPADVLVGDTIGNHAETFIAAIEAIGPARFAGRRSRWRLNLRRQYHH